MHRVPAEHLENILLAQVGRLFRTPTVLARICNEDFTGALTTPQTEQALSSIHSVWSQMFPLEQHKLIHTLISKVVVFEDKIQIHFEATGLAGLLKEAGADFEIADGNKQLEANWKKIRLEPVSLLKHAAFFIPLPQGTLSGKMIEEDCVCSVEFDIT